MRREDFQRPDHNIPDGEIARTLPCPRRDVRHRFVRNRPALFGLAVITVLVLLALLGPHLSGHTYDGQNLQMTNQPPGYRHWFGTDFLGRDIFTRVWYGVRISLMIGVLTSLICFMIGVVYGGISGYAGGRVDDIMMRVVEVLSSIPFLLYVILLMVLMEPGLKAIFTALGSVYWVTVARVVRGQVLALKEADYVISARALGAGAPRILFRHIIPNAMGPVIVTMTLMIPEAIFTEAWLSFLGLGVGYPMASLGVLASEGMEGLRNYPWQLLFPALFIGIAILAFNFLGEGIREALDPRLRR
ncbi:MAG: ABC transporter permease [Bacillota bacterium]